ncbi:glycosyltransferase family 4 protein [Bizionia paragorgiae]|uniref:glycosyltransferase family 4 protein n=1 Tax=Bizionia paragorgiae TaxID=283786 RepID=UPI00299F1136|nr:glycosyltransferase family 4 protein [Bizionia paragorgiae]MDX1271108.1 glycosyltransferase family 4 protein [Bizionia paragorgiae]
MMKNKNKLFLISNMYPSKEHIRYGIFVKNFERAVEHEFLIEKCVLTKRTHVLSKLLGYLVLYLKILSLVFKVKSKDVIYVHFPLHMAPSLWVVRFFCENMVLNFHGSDLVFRSSFTKVLSCFQNALIKKCFLVVPSNYYKHKIINSYVVNNNKVYVYPSGGIDTSVFYPNRKDSIDRFLIGFVSNFIQGKGWDLLLTAIENIVKNNSIKNLELIMVGEGPDRNKICERLDKININHNIISSMSQEDLAEVYNSMSLFVFPTYREEESLGLVGLEAMACGTPVVAGEVGGPLGYIDHGVNSFLFKKRDFYDLELKIMEYYNLSNQKKAEIRTNGINTAKLYDRNRVNKGLLVFLKELS